MKKISFRPHQGRYFAIIALIAALACSHPLAQTLPAHLVPICSSQEAPGVSLPTMWMRLS